MVHEYSSRSNEVLVKDCMHTKALKETGIRGQGLSGAGAGSMWLNCIAASQAGSQQGSQVNRNVTDVTYHQQIKISDFLLSQWIGSCALHSCGSSAPCTQVGGGLGKSEVRLT